MSSSGAPSSVTIDQPTEIDCLLGRGAGVRQHAGNRRFLELAYQHQKAYRSCITWDEKNRVAYQVIEAFRPGRFLEFDRNDVWVEVRGQRALAKTKQALREARSPEQHASVVRRRRVMARPQEEQHTRGLFMNANVNPAFIPQAMNRVGAYSHYETGRLAGGIIDCLASLQAVGAIGATPPFRPSTIPPCLLQQFGLSTPSPMASIELPSTQFLTPMARTWQTFRKPDDATVRAFPCGNHQLRGDAREPSRAAAMTTEQRTVKNSSSDARQSLRRPLLSTQEMGVAQSLCSMQTNSQLPFQLDPELTEQERAAVLSDLFGNLCTVTQPCKRAKRCLPRDSAMTATTGDNISSLLLEMKRKVDILPTAKKKAWMEASRKGRASEINDRRMELFLRREDMDPTRAARRWVTYWTERRECFGPDVFCLPMTLHGAMKDDHLALEAGVNRILPGVDDSGRQISLSVVGWRNGATCTPDTMIRLMWYHQEILSRHPNAAKGIVRLVDFKGATFNFFEDFAVVLKTTHLQACAFPIPARATHIFNLPSGLSKMLSFALAQLNTETRARIVMHYAPESQTVWKLAEYGIPFAAIPIELGGSCDYNHSRWLADQRAGDAEWQHLPGGTRSSQLCSTD